MPLPQIQHGHHAYPRPKKPALAGSVHDVSYLGDLGFRPQPHNLITPDVISSGHAGVTPEEMLRVVLLRAADWEDTSEMVPSALTHDAVWTAQVLPAPRQDATSL